MKIIIAFFSLQPTQAIRGKDEQKEICFVSLQDFKKKKLELVLPTANTIHGKWSSENKNPVALKYC